MGRQEWSKEVEYVLACVGNAVGLGNLWRFPYLCYSSGGGAFLIPYFIMLFVCGIPLLYMELAVGQYTKQGPVGALKKLCPLFQGAGLATVVLSFFLCTYYNVILSWALYFMFSSFQFPLPWSSCNESWNDPTTCWNSHEMNSSSLFVRPNDSESATKQFFEHKILEQSSGLHEQGTIRWELVLLLLFTWTIVYFSIFRGVKWTGKIVYFTATFPYILIVTLLCYGVTLPGSMQGIKFFVQPDWELLKSPKVWVYAAAQNFNSIGIAFGSMIAFASYSKKEHNIFRDALAICCLNSCTSILSGFAIFSILGYVAFNQGQDVGNVVTGGPGLVFMVYPEAFSVMSYPYGNILAFLFFFNLLLLGIDSQFASVEVVITTLDDHFRTPLLRLLRRKEFLILLVCVFAFLLGLPNVTNGGIYFFTIIDNYSSGISLMLIAFFEVIAFTWFYGAKRLAKNIEEMNGKPPFLYFIMCWYVLSPVLILAIMIFNWIDYKPVTYGDYEYQLWGELLGWAIAACSLVCVPAGMVKAIAEADGDTVLKKLRNSIRPQIDVDCVVKQSIPDLAPIIVVDSNGAKIGEIFEEGAAAESSNVSQDTSYVQLLDYKMKTPV